MRQPSVGKRPYVIIRVALFLLSLKSSRFGHFPPPLPPPVLYHQNSAFTLMMNWHDAADAGNLERVQVLMKQGVDKDKVDIRGNTALFNASFRGHFSMVLYLLEQGADKDIANNYGTTPLIIASCHGHLEVARCLLEQGADKDKAANDGFTPIHMAANIGHLEIAKLIMSYGANLNVRSNGNRLPIDVAANEEMKQAIRDEPRRRMDHGHKRATERDRQINVATISASTQQDDEEAEQGKKNPRLGEGTVSEEEARILAEINEDSEPSDEEDD